MRFSGALCKYVLILAGACVPVAWAQSQEAAVQRLNRTEFAASVRDFVYLSSARHVAQLAIGAPVPRSEAVFYRGGGGGQAGPGSPTQTQLPQEK